MYENGVFRPLTLPRIPDHKAVHLIIEDAENLPGMQAAAMMGEAFDFLKNPGEDIYSAADGDPLT